MRVACLSWAVKVHLQKDTDETWAVSIVCDVPRITPHWLQDSHLPSKVFDHYSCTFLKNEFAIRWDYRVGLKWEDNNILQREKGEELGEEEGEGKEKERWGRETAVYQIFSKRGPCTSCISINLVTCYSSKLLHIYCIRYSVSEIVQGVIWFWYVL